MTKQILTLPKAVYNAIVEMIGIKGSFSIYEITTYIRNKANSKEWEFPGLEGPLNPFNIAYNINHDAVKTIFNWLLNSKELDLLGLNNVEDTGKYLIYHFKPTGKNDTTVNTDTVKNLGHCTVKDETVKNLNPIMRSGNGILIISEKIENRIMAYITSNPTDDVTLKRIQSAMKINNLTCKQIYDFLKVKGVYLVENGPLSEYYIPAQ